MTARARTVPLGDIATFIRGITFRPEDVVPRGSPASVDCMRTSNVQVDLELEDVWGIPVSCVGRDDQYLRPGDILVSSANSWNLVGKCCWVPRLPTQATFGGFVTALRCSSPELDARYLYRWFSSSRVQATVRSFGRKTTNISNLSLDRCRALAVPLPPIDEQRRIADIIDRADALRTKRRTALALLDELTQSIFVDMFGDPSINPKGWPLRSFDNVMRDESARSAKVKQADFLSTGAYPVVDQGQLAVAGYWERQEDLCQSKLPVIVFGDHTRAVKLQRRPFVVGADGVKVLVPVADVDADYRAASR